MPVKSQPELPKSSPFQTYGGKILVTVLIIFMVYAVVFLGTLIRNNMQKFYSIGRAEKSERTMVIEAQGKVTIKPDIAVTSMGMVSEAATVAEAQKKNTEVMNKLIEKLKELSIEAKDIQTVNYNVYPQYDYTQAEGQKLKGYQVSQNVTVKIRNLDNANKVLALAGEVGANNVSGLSFTVDDRDLYKNQALEQALQKVHQKALVRSRALGVRVVGVMSYSEYEGEQGGYGGPVAKSVEQSLGANPAVESGSTEVVMNVTVTYEIR